MSTHTSRAKALFAMQDSGSTSDHPQYHQTPVWRSVASSILAKFSPGSSIQHKMDVQNQLIPGDLPRRPKPTVSYAESEPSSRSSSQSEGFSNPDNDEDEEDDEIIEYAAAPRRRALRERRPNMSLKAQENSEAPKRSRGRKHNAADSVGRGRSSTAPTFSERTAIRHEITNKTAALRSRFFVEKKDFLLPLLPPNNHVRKMVEKHEQLSPEELAELPAVTPYEEIGTQPRGVTATMKPYQLSGLSFMVYLHRNGLSGILGDEMGLGKTLQTLSLIQYLKENDPKTGSGKLQRPFLVVCPLSVLSSWMAEAKKWTPSLRVVRFHGPIKERDKLKKIVMGEIDMYGNMTRQARSKFKSRRNAAGKTVVSLDTDSEDEKDVGVDLVVTTYDSFKAEQSWFKKALIWRYVVLDEGHTVKNHESLVSKALQGMNAEYRLILTGTPLQNNLSELWSLLHWLYPEVFVGNTNELFDSSFNLSKGQYSKDVLDNSRHLLELIMLRRMKGSPGVDLNLPPKSEVLLFVPLSPMQRFWYERMITKADRGLLDELFKGLKDKEVDALKSMKEGEEREAGIMAKKQKALEMLNDSVGTEDAWKETKAILEETVQREQAMEEDGSRKSAWQKLMNLLMQLRKVCNHPYQISHAEPDPYNAGDHVIHASGKFIVLEKLLNELVIKQKKKILIFSGFTKMLDLVEELLLLRGGDGSCYRAVRIDGSTARARRNLSIRMFNDLSSDYRVMLISTRAGGLGINLASASDVVLLDQDWNPQITLQAEARAHRIGQKNPVTIYKLVSQGTVEEQMMGRIQKKLYLSAKVTEAMEDIHTKFGNNKKAKKGRSSEADDNMPQLNTSQLMTLVRRGASAISRPEIDVNEMLAWDWETTVMKCKDQPTDINVKKDAIPDAKVDQEAEQKWLSELERVESSVYAGKKLARTKNISNKELAEEFDRAERRKGKNTTVMVDGFAISKESMNCKQWEAVPTMGNKNAAFAEPKRAKRAPVEAQSHCQVCLDGGELVLCQRCPRSYHMKCLDKGFQATAKGWQFNCPQHECYDCLQKTTDAGGMLYRCRFCEKAYCEDCLDFEKSTLIGDTLPEFDLLNYPEATQAFYIQCHICADHFEQVPNDKKMCEDVAESARIRHEEVFGEQRESSTGPASLTDATTAETTSVNTPMEIEDDEVMFVPNKNKRKLDTLHFEVPLKRGRLGV
ncbi:p-loop containing nucleoside triphosphate hydrolase [Venustampulla echinocandica]|uniref:p-loop containing nucleoside triphosphate hydrolase n=1 Tax=Venustampulla echinocandica TaxID=2656787 RepID=A0A370T9N7_9HELO|nr:p-loop containing nucleoside triphosphate hydrolase [Venustampulla echinocandica]RDL30369.1 p-loop containing nucleoside triphosphate hydrolase [Venustampulla echinocandica]